MTTMKNEEERFEADLRAAMAPEPASDELRRRVLAGAVPRRQRTNGRHMNGHRPGGALAGWLAAFDPRNWLGNWRMPVLVELGALAAAASLAVGIFAGASGLMLSTSTTASASTDNTVDLVALAYEGTGTTGDLQ